MNRTQVICFFYNEETLARLFVQHYAWADEILAVVSKSVDQTREVLAKAPNVRLMDFEFPNGMNDKIKTEMVNRLTMSPSEFDWLIVVDSDEFIWPQDNSNPAEFLTSVPSEFTMLKARMRNVFRHHTETDLDVNRPPAPQRQHGDPNHFSAENIQYQKPIVFRANRGIYLGLGNHDQAGGVISPSHWFEGAHWQNADPSFAVTRRVRDRRDRQSPENRAYGLGHQNHHITENDILRLCEERRDCPKIFNL